MCDQCGLTVTVRESAYDSAKSAWDDDGTRQLVPLPQRAPYLVCMECFCAIPNGYMRQHYKVVHSTAGTPNAEGEM